MKYHCQKILPLLVLAFILLAAGCGENAKMEKPWKSNNPSNIRGVISYKRIFGDLNDVHLSSAKEIGIRPVQSRQEAENRRRELLYVFSNKYYRIDSLTHSIPYLVPKAGVLLFEIGYNFCDSLKSKGLNPYCIITTSILRTKEDVERLKRRNGNASLNSAHFYGTTFDISYNRFEQIENPDSILQPVREDTLKMVLSEVLRDLKKKDRCYVKHELKQGCFHITVR